MKAFLCALIVLASCGFAEAGGNRVLLLRNSNCNDGVLQVQRFRQRQVFVQRQRFGNRQRFVGNGGGSTVVIERRNGFFGIGGRERTIIQN
jgi:hypothetical protein